MNFKSLRLKTKLYKKNHFEDGFDAEINDGTIIAQINYFFDEHISKNMLHFVDIHSYKYSPTITKNFDGDFNIIFKYVALRNGDEIKTDNIYGKLTWWERQKLHLIMGDHVILKDGNFKWVIGTALTVIFFVYTAKQNYKLVESWKENAKLKDQIHILETKITKDKK